MARSSPLSSPLAGNATRSLKELEPLECMLDTSLLALLRLPVDGLPDTSDAILVATDMVTEYWQWLGTKPIYVWE